MTALRTTLRRRRRYAEAAAARGDAAPWTVYAMTGGAVHHAAIVRGLRSGGDTHMMQLLLRWCGGHGARLHPALTPVPSYIVAGQGDAATFRDFRWVVTEDVPALTPLLAIPESVCIGFKDTESEDDVAALKQGTTSAAASSVDDTKKAADEESDSDMCAFFFTALGLLVNDLLVAVNNSLTDPRYLLARALQRTRTCHNAPYLEPHAFNATMPAHGDGTSLAAVFLQMVHNYIQAGPLTGKVERDMLLWAVSVCLSHSTPLEIAGRRSIGIVPLLHLFPHGAGDVNAAPVTRRARGGSGCELADFFAAVSPAMSLERKHHTNYIFVVTTRPVRAGEAVALQAMAPVCNRTEEADDMWRLTCGAPPPADSVTSGEYQEIVKLVNDEVHRRAKEERSVAAPR